MKKILILTCIALLGFACTKVTKVNQPNEPVSFKDGDVIFHTSKSRQSKMLKYATGSSLTHVGVIFFEKGEPYVFEAVSPVKKTKLSSFISRGEDSEYKIMRTKTELTSKQAKKIKSYVKFQLGKQYDLKFQWSDSKMYCSELVWKGYAAAGIELCETKTFEDFSLTGKAVLSAIKSRYGSDKNFNEKETVVAPADLFESDKLALVFDNY